MVKTMYLGFRERKPKPRRETQRRGGMECINPEHTFPDCQQYQKQQCPFLPSPNRVPGSRFHALRPRNPHGRVTKAPQETNEWFYTTVRVTLAITRPGKNRARNGPGAPFRSSVCRSGPLPLLWPTHSTYPARRPHGRATRHAIAACRQTL